MLGGVGIARQGADAGKGAGLEAGALAAPEQVGMGLEEVQQLGKAAGRETVAAADARAFLEMDGLGEAVLGEHLVRDLKRLLEAHGPAQAMPADLQEDLVGDVIVRADEQLGENLRKGARLAVNVDRLQALGTAPVTILPLRLPPARSMNAAISSPAYCRPTAGSWVRLIRLRP